MDNPKLRAIEAFPTEDGMICLRDPQRFSDRILLLPVNLFFVCALFDGKHSILDIQAEYTRKFGDLLFREKVEEIIGKLDDCLFLESERFEEAKDRAVSAFRRDPVRRAAHSGTAYEADPKALIDQLDGFFASAPPCDPQGSPCPSGRLQAIVAPHIDPGRGGACYAASYGELARADAAKLYVILGVAHTATSQSFALTRKDFETPLGKLETDGDFVEGLAGRFGKGCFADEFVHSGEHSIEFQIIFLQHLLRRKSEAARIVPVLCSSFLHRMKPGGGVPAEVADFLSALRELSGERREEVCFIAGVDLSHLGRRFGQDVRLTPEFAQNAEREDRAMLKPVIEGDAGAFLRHIEAEKDARNVCGVPAIYALLSVLDAGSGRFLHYGRAEEPQTGSLVTFASLAFYRRDQDGG